MAYSDQAFRINSFVSKGKVMRKYSIAATVAAVSMMSVAAIAADLPEPPPTVYIPPPIYPEPVAMGGLYLRGSLALAAVSAADLECACGVSDVSDFKAGYGFGLGLGYEFGYGMRAEATLDYLQFKGITAANGRYGNFRAAIAMAKVYYDFDISGGASASGGYGYGAGGYGGSIKGGGSASASGSFIPYIGGGIGFANVGGQFYDPCDCLIAIADSNTWAASLAAGVSYDLGGGVKTDFGYEFLYLNEIKGLGAGVTNGFDIDAHGVYAHQVKASLRVAIN